ncbi:MAG: response regulator [Pseudomonadota bacterium]|nr:response regulator [Pseudomonadota bacterium]
MNTPFQSSTILIGDDDADDRFLVEEALAECEPRYPLRFAQDGVEVMDYLHRVGPYADTTAYPTPGLILLDLNMPRKGGREVLREIRSDPHLRNIPVVVWTTSRAEEDLEGSYLDGANRCITKPSNFQEIQLMLRDLTQTWLPQQNCSDPGKAVVKCN